MSQYSVLKKSTRPPTLIFFHIPKTAGLSLDVILEHEYGQRRVYTPRDYSWINSYDQLAQVPIERRARYAVITGHFQFGLHTLLPGPSVYFTLLREPIDRVLSLYYYIRQTPVHPLYQTVTAHNLSLEQFLDQIETIEFDNFSVRCLAGAVAVPVGQCAPDLLESAKQNLRQHFSMAGLTERFDETVILLRRAFGWRIPLYLRRNITPNRKAKDQIEPHLIHRLEAMNELDIALYQYVQAEFNEQIRRQGASFQRELHLFQRLNRAYNRIYPSLLPARKVKHWLLGMIQSFQSPSRDAIPHS
jgi:hypothetical protein